MLKGQTNTYLQYIFEVPYGPPSIYIPLLIYMVLDHYIAKIRSNLFVTLRKEKERNRKCSVLVKDKPETNKI